MVEQSRHFPFKIKPILSGEQIADAVDIELSSAEHTGAFANSGHVQEAIDRLDATGLGANPTVITGSFFSSSANIATWYGGRQSDTIETSRTLANGNYTFELPDNVEIVAMFDDLVARGLGEVYTRTFVHSGGNTTFVGNNSLTIKTASISNLFNINELPTTLAQGAAATFRIVRQGGIVGSWERVSVEDATDAFTAFGTFQFQTLGWNNRDFSFLPTSGQVQKGYAFRVTNSDPNDGTLRQGLLDSGVSDRFIYNGDWVVWTADAFTAWTDGDNWAVFSDGEVNRFTREAQRFLTQISEIDNRVDVAPVAMLTSDALVWLSENPLAAAPFLTPSTDTNNPRTGDNYAYIGGRENRNEMNQFQFSANRFGSYMTVGITPSFITGHPESDIRVRILDTDRAVLSEFNLDTDFTFVDDATFTNGTVRHYQRSTSINYPFLATIEIVLTEVQRHFVLNPNSVNVSANIPEGSLTEFQLNAEAQTKLNANLTPDNSRFEEIEPRLCPYIGVTHSEPETEVLYLDSTGSDTYPPDLTGFNAVSSESTRFTGGDIALFLATPEPGSFALRNITADTIVSLADSEATVDVLASIRDETTSRTYFIYRVTGLTSGHVYEVERTTSQQVLQWPNDIDNIQADVQRIDAELEHALLGLADEVVQVFEHEITVAEESAPTVLATAFNTGLGDTAAQTVFYETSPNAPGGGVTNSTPFSDLAGDRIRRKLVYFPEGTAFTNQAYLAAFDGTTGRDLIRYDNGVFNAKVLVPATSAGSSTETIYPAPSTLVSGAGIWINIPALTFQNGLPVPEADEVFFTRNIPPTATELTVQYRGHSNGNIFGTNSTTLAGVGGGADAFATVTLDTGGELANVQIHWDASQRNIRVSVTEVVRTGLPTINDVEVILSYTETRTIPATTETTRDVQIENEQTGAQVFAVKPSATDTVIIVGDRTEIDTGYAYTTAFGASEDGYLIATTETVTFLNYEDFDPITSTIADLENHAGLPQFGLFTTQYTHETIVALGTQLTVLDSSGTVRSVGAVLSDLLTRVTALEA